MLAGNGCKNPKSLSVKVICHTAMFTAISAVCNVCTLFVGPGNSFALSFTYVPDFFAGALFGPFAGFLTGFLGDLIGCLAAPKGALNPIILLASGLMGFIPGVVFRHVKNGEANFCVLRTIISVLAVLCVCSGLNTLGLYLFYFKGAGNTLGAVFALRMPKQIIVWGINSVLIFLLEMPVFRHSKI